MKTIKFKFRTSGTDKYLTVKNTGSVFFPRLNSGIQYITPHDNGVTIVLLPGFKPVDTDNYIEIVEE